MITTEKTSSIQDFMDQVKTKNPSQNDFHQAVHEVVESVYPFIEKIKNIKTLKY